MSALKGRVEGFLRVRLVLGENYFYTVELSDKDFQDAGLREDSDLSELLSDLSRYIGPAVKEKLWKELDGMKVGRDRMANEVNNFESALREID